MVLIEVQRFFTNAISSQDESLLSSIQQSKGEHAPEVLHTICSSIFVEMQDRLTVAPSAETMTSVAQGLPQFYVIVDLSIGDKNQRAVFIP